jgi:hypothetical protein
LVIGVLLTTVCTAKQLPVQGGHKPGLHGNPVITPVAHGDIPHIDDGLALTGGTPHLLCPQAVVTVVTEHTNGFTMLACMAIEGRIRVLGICKPMVAHAVTDGTASALHRLLLLWWPGLRPPSQDHHRTITGPSQDHCDRGW